MMRKRLEYQGGIAQEDRMIKDKYKAFLHSLLYSYQSATVKMADALNRDFDTAQSFKALINPNKVKQDYDDKILSVDYGSGFGLGDVFEWTGTQTHWLIYLQELTEDAYFRGHIRRCKYQIKFKDENGNECVTWAAVRGPTETDINSIQKNQIRIDNPNWGLNILMPLNDKTLKAFDRYSEFLFAGKCWQVQATDSISMKNILEVNAQEYYIDRDTDDVENELKNGLVIEPSDPTPDSLIQGEAFIKPQIAEIYTAPVADGQWKVLENCPVCIRKLTDTSVEVTWRKSVSGQFTLQWVKDKLVDNKVIVVESLF